MSVPFARTAVDQEPENSPGPGRVLVLNHHRDALGETVSELRKNGFAVDVAESLAETESRLEESSPDVTILNPLVLEPGCVELELIERLQSHGAALRSETAAAFAAGTGAEVAFTVTNPTPGREQETLVVSLAAADVTALHELGWSSALRGDIFDPMPLPKAISVSKGSESRLGRDPRAGEDGDGWFHDTVCLGMGRGKALISAWNSTMKRKKRF